ncbi:MAG: DUF4114 domain-containing protein, partial [Acidobacteriota bacterium]
DDPASELLRFDADGRPIPADDLDTPTLIYRPGIGDRPGDLYQPGDGDGLFIPVDPYRPVDPSVGLDDPAAAPSGPADPPYFDPDRFAPAGSVDGFVLQTDTQRPGFDGGGSYTAIVAGEDDVNGIVARFDGAQGSDHLELQFRDPASGEWRTLIADTRRVDGQPEFALPTVRSGHALEFRAINHTQGTEIRSDSGLVQVEDRGDGTLALRFEDRRTERGDFNDLELTVSRPGLTIQELAQQTGPDEGGDFEEVKTTEAHDRFGIQYAESNANDDLQLQYKNPETGEWETLVESTKHANWFEKADLGSLPAGAELEFKLVNRTTGRDYTSDSGMAKVERNDDGSITFAFEDRENGDRDFNDFVFTVHRPGAAPLGRPTRPEVGSSFATLLSSVDLSNDEKRAAIEAFFAEHPQGGILAPAELEALTDFVNVHAPDLATALLDHWLPPLPFTDAQIDAVDSAVQDAFFDRLAQAEEGTPEKVFYNLMRVLALAHQKPFEGKVDIDKVQADLEAMQNDPETIAGFQAIQAELRAEETASQLGPTAVDELVGYITGPAFQERLRLMPADQQEAAVREAFDHLAKIAPTDVYNEALLDFQAAGFNHDPEDFLKDVPIEDAELAVGDVINEILTKGQLGLAPFTYLADSISHLSGPQQAQLVRGITEAARVSNGDLTPEGMLLELERLGLDAEIGAAARNFVDTLQARGAFDAFFAFAGAAALIYNASEGNLPTDPVGRLGTAAGAMAVISKGEATAKLVGATELLGLDTSSAQNLKWLGQGLQDLGGNLAAQAGRLQQIFQMDRPTAEIELANMGVEDTEAFYDAVEDLGVLDNPEAEEQFFDALSEISDEEEFFDAFESFEELEQALGGEVEMAEIGRTAAAQAAAQGTETAGDFAVVAGRVGAEAAEEAPSVFAKSLEAAGHTLKVLNWLGPLADGITAGLATKDAIDDFKAGDNVGGALEIGEAAAATTSAFATAAFLLGTGVGAPIALGATVVGFGLAIADYFHHRARQRNEIEGY